MNAAGTSQLQLPTGKRGPVAARAQGAGLARRLPRAASNSALRWTVLAQRLGHDATVPREMASQVLPSRQGQIPVFHQLLAGIPAGELNAFVGFDRQPAVAVGVVEVPPCAGAVACAARERSVPGATPAVAHDVQPIGRALQPQRAPTHFRPSSRPGWPSRPRPRRAGPPAPAVPSRAARAAVPHEAPGIWHPARAAPGGDPRLTTGPPPA